MYAIIEDSGRQFKVQPGDTIEVEIRDLAADQQTIQFDRVLMLGDGAGSRVGTPLVAGAAVLGRIDGPVKGPKLDVIKFRRRKGYRVKTGHRQRYLRVTITEIKA
jgi:large subunit ribosomal protein L21